MFEVGKKYKLKKTNVEPYECVFVGKSGVVLQRSDGYEHVTYRQYWTFWEEHHEPVIEERFMSIGAYELQPRSVAVHMGPKYRPDDNIKVTFTDGKLTGVEII